MSCLLTRFIASIRPSKRSSIPLMEDFYIDIIIGEGPGARSIKMPLPRFHTGGSNYPAGLLTAPLRGRFGIIHRLNFYSHEELNVIIKQSVVIRLSRSTTRVLSSLRCEPRNAENCQPPLASGARLREVKADGRITRAVAIDALSVMDVDIYGFDEMDRKLMLTILEIMGSGRRGSTLGRHQ